MRVVLEGVKVHGAYLVDVVEQVCIVSTACY